MVDEGVGTQIVADARVGDATYDAERDRVEAGLFRQFVQPEGSKNLSEAERRRLRGELNVDSGDTGDVMDDEDGFELDDTTTPRSKDVRDAARDAQAQTDLEFE